MDQLGTIGGTLGLFTGMSLLSMIEIVFFLYAFFKSCVKFESKNLKAAVQVIILGKKEGRSSDDEIGNTDEFVSDCSSDELKAKVKQNEEKINQLEKKHDDLKQLLMLLVPPDKKYLVQEHFDEKEKCALSLHSSKKDNTSFHNDKQTVQDNLNVVKVDTYQITIFYAL